MCAAPQQSIYLGRLGTEKGPQLVDLGEESGNPSHGLEGVVLTGEWRGW